MLLIKNGRVMDPKSGLDQVCDVLVQGGKIIKIAPEIKEEGAANLRCYWSCSCSWLGRYSCSFP